MNDLQKAEALIGTSWDSPRGPRTVVGVQQVADGVRLQVITNVAHFVELIPLARLDKDRAFDEESAGQTAKHNKRIEEQAAAKAEAEARFDALTAGYLACVPPGAARNRARGLLRQPLFLGNDPKWTPNETGAETLVRLFGEGCEVACETKPRTRYLLTRPSGTFHIIQKTYFDFGSFILNP